MKRIESNKLITKVIIDCFLINTIWCLPGCSGNSDKPRQENNVEVLTKTAFELPEIPVSLNTPEGRSDYLIRHYWDNFDFTDTLSISNPEAAEQFFVDFVDISSRMSLPTAREGIISCSRHPKTIKSRISLLTYWINICMTLTRQCAMKSYISRL